VGGRSNHSGQNAHGEWAVYKGQGRARALVITSNVPMSKGGSYFTTKQRPGGKERGGKFKKKKRGSGGNN